MSKVQQLSDHDSEEKVFGSQLPVFVDFYGDHCLPCRQMEPAIEDLAREYEGQIQVYKINGKDGRLF